MNFPNVSFGRQKKTQKWKNGLKLPDDNNTKPKTVDLTKIEHETEQEWGVFFGVCVCVWFTKLLFNILTFFPTHFTHKHTDVEFLTHHKDLKASKRWENKVVAAGRRDETEQGKKEYIGMCTRPTHTQTE